MARSSALKRGHASGPRRYSAYVAMRVTRTVGSVARTASRDHASDERWRGGGADRQPPSRNHELLGRDIQRRPRRGELAVSRRARNPHNGPPLVVRIKTAELETFADGVLPRPCGRRQRIADDRHTRRPVTVVGRERATADDRHAERREIRRVDGFEVERGIAGDLVRRLAFGGEPREIPPGGAGERLDVEGRDGLDAWHRRDARPRRRRGTCVGAHVPA